MGVVLGGSLGVQGFQWAFSTRCCTCMDARLGGDGGRRAGDVGGAVGAVPGVSLGRRSGERVLNRCHHV